MRTQKEISSTTSQNCRKNENGLRTMFSGAKDVIIRLSPNNIDNEISECISPIACLKSGAIVLSDIKKEFGEESINLLIRVWLVKLNDSFNITEKMNEQQIKDTAKGMVNDFQAYNMAEIRLMFEMMIKGELGEVYNRLDCQTIYKLLRVYKKKRQEAAIKWESEKSLAKYLDVDYKKYNENNRKRNSRPRKVGDLLRQSHCKQQ